jgi:lipoprotein-anchoring transpeptidase ErfK/SrfK
VLVVVLAAGFAAAARWWSGATLADDPAALARIELQPLAGKVSSITATGADGKPVTIVRRNGKLTPAELVPAGEKIQVALTVRRSRWVGWLAGHTQREHLTVTTPVAKVRNSWPTLTGGELQLRYSTPVDRVAVGSRTVQAGGRRLVSLGKQQPTGTLVVAAAARPWERPGTPTRVSWFPSTPQPAVQVTPAPGTEISPLTPIRLTFAAPVGSARPRFTGGVPGTWRLVDSHTLVFDPGTLGFEFGESLHLTLPGASTIVAGEMQRNAAGVDWTVSVGSLTRLHQLLAEEGYLPVVWNANGADVRRTASAEVRAAIDPPAGSFGWRYPNTPKQLTRQWNATKITEITRGAIMTFEHDHGLAADGFAGPLVWHALLADAVAGKVHQGGYSYVFVHTALPQLLTLWHNGNVVLTSPGNTGIPATPTQPGTYPVFEHIPVGTMSGTNPDGSHYHDTGIRWISYFHRGEALHAFNRASFGTPQSLGCVELPLASAAKVWPYTPIGTLVTIENPSK